VTLAALVGCVRAAPAAAGAPPPTAPTVRAEATSPPLPEAAAPLDRSALSQIDQAIEQLYLAGREGDAEAKLKGIYQACGERCSAPVKARAWMYIGIIWGNAKAGAGRAREAFRFALSLDAGITLDEALASPETRRAFELEKAAATGVDPTPEEGAPRPRDPKARPPGPRAGGEPAD